MAVIADEENRPAICQVDLHPDQTVGVTRKMVESDALAEIKAALVEGFPVAVGEEPTKSAIHSSTDKPHDQEEKKNKKTHRSNFR